MSASDYLNRLFNLRGKVVVVTGATGQLGAEICSAFSHMGTYVVGVDKVLNENKQVISERCEYLETDIVQRDQVISIMNHVFNKYEHIDVLVNNAGVSCFEPFEDRPEDSFDWVMDVNLKGTFFCTQSYVNKLKKSQSTGCIVNIGSIYGVISPDYRIYTDCDRKNSEVYGATKAGVIQMTRYFAAHFAKDKIRVNCVSPGGIFKPDSPQSENFIKNYSYRCPMGAMASAEDMVGGILYLSSDAAAYTTGQNLIIDGGMSCW